MSVTLHVDSSVADNSKGCVMLCTGFLSILKDVYVLETVDERH